MTEQELADIEFRERVATAGPLSYRPFGKEAAFYGVSITAPSGTLGLEVSGDNVRADVDFYANARRDVPALLAEVRFLRRVLLTQCGWCGGEEAHVWNADCPRMLRCRGLA